MEHILKYFPQLSERQRQQLQVLLEAYPEWNAKINVISRKDIDNLEVNHVLHSMAIAKFLQFTPGTRILDLGAGGGFPSVPLALLFPEVSFLLVDRVGKKLRVAADVAERADLKNVAVQHGDIKEVKGCFDFVVSRAVMPFPEMVPLVRRLIDRTGRNAMPNGVICLKGGDLSEELRPFKKQVLVDELTNYFDEEYFQTKKIVYLPL
ncbi:MAG: 16S rRNA (guanine(527)-N(7))-methyltransferase RsmG [Muribaculaceae bacterium]|nr:16S rRNA (guanine(527)-N(7))-methyltransferase RsmG [Muribaculaceae bacterium]